MGLVFGLVAGELYGEDKPHAEFLAVSPSVSSNIAASGGLVLSNVSAQIVTYHPVELNLEHLIPHDHLVIQTSELTPPTEKGESFQRCYSWNGAKPFFPAATAPIAPRVSSSQAPAILV